MFYFLITILMASVGAGVYFHAQTSIIITLITGIFGLLTLIIRDKLKQESAVSKALNELKASNDKGHDSINTTLQEVKKDVTYVLNLHFDTNTYSKSFEHIKARNTKLSTDDRLTALLIAKADSIIRTAMWMHQQGFYLPTGEPNTKFTMKNLLEKMNAEIKTIKRDGIDILGKDFMEKFYTKHAARIEKFTQDLTFLFNDTANSKHKRAQELFEDLLCDSMVSLVAFYNKFPKSKLKGHNK